MVTGLNNNKEIVLLRFTIHVIYDRYKCCLHVLSGFPMNF